VLLNYEDPGNVRELQNILERAVALEVNQELTAQNLRSYLDDHLSLKKGGLDLDIPNEGINLEKLVEEIERTLLLKALDRTHGIKKKNSGDQFPPMCSGSQTWPQPGHG
jgi:two-component system response regulator PilR (NtrC family)